MAQQAGVRRAPILAAVSLAALLVAGCAAVPPATPSPSPVAVATATPTPSQSPAPSSTPTPTSSPSPSPTPTSDPRLATGPAGRPTRVEVPALRIDLPVFPPPENSTWPLCDVAEYFKPPLFQHPGAGGVTYIYAHAQAGMFLPILEASRVDGGQALKGQTVRVWTKDNQLYTYRIRRFWRHQESLDWVLGLPRGSLILQTSEGPAPGVPGHTGLVVMLEARQVGPPIAATRAEAQPRPHPRTCGP